MKIKDSITSKEYKKLLAQSKGQDMREYKRQNLLNTFIILYYTGLRLNEIQNLNIKDIQELLKEGELKIYTSKTKSERKLYLSKDFEKDILKYFNLEQDSLNKVIQKHNYKRSSIHEKSYVMLINKFMKETLGDSYTSHSFRQGILTEMASKGINVKIMAKFINHKNVSTTLRYVTPTDDDVKNAMIR